MFVLVAVGLLAVAPRIGSVDLAWVALIAVAVLLVGSLLHEVAHLLVVLRLGGDVDQVVLGPMGGVTRCSLPPPSESVWIAALAGPMANFALAAAAAVALALNQGERGRPVPYARSGRDTAGSPGLVALKLTVWINWLLGLVNLLPAFPFDGGTALRAIFRPLVGSRTAIVYVFRVAISVAVGLLVVAWLVRDAYAQAAMPAWLPLAGLAIFLCVSAQRDAVLASRRVPEEDPFETDALDDSDALLFEELDDEEEGILIESWRQKIRDESDTRQEQEDLEEARLDDVLARLHGKSLDQLSFEDRQLLQRASARYRNRLRSKMSGSED